MKSECNYLSRYSLENIRKNEPKMRLVRRRDTKQKNKNPNIGGGNDGKR